LFIFFSTKTQKCVPKVSEIRIP